MPVSLELFRRRLKVELDTLREAVVEHYGQVQPALVNDLHSINYSDWPDFLEKHFLLNHEPKLNRLVQLEAALAQFEIGQYGYCADCEEPIELEQLDADPAAQRCKRCSH
jgi:RNA polymerase-binding transcription factor DksA